MRRNDADRLPEGPEVDLGAGRLPKNYTYWVFRAGWGLGLTDIGPGLKGCGSRRLLGESQKNGPG
jgi:hypothetical protein